MATDWHKLRSLNGSQEKGFEELCCQLAAGEPRLAGATYVRKGAPDAGVECFWTLPNGDEDGWQAKYFLAPPTSGQWSQVDESVKTALEKHLRLKRYVVCMPLDRSDRRLRGEKTFLARWNERVAAWKKLAAKKKMAVVFEYWGDHELTSRLNSEVNRGRHWFWFSTEQFTLAWFREALAVSIRNADERYSPDVHVDLPIAASFAALGRTPAFYAQLNDRYTKLWGVVGRFEPNRVPNELSSAANELHVQMGAIASHLEGILLSEDDRARTPTITPIPWQEVGALTRSLADSLHKAAGEVRAKLWATPTEKDSKDEKARGARKALEEASWACGQVASELDDLADYCAGHEARLANRPTLLLVGEAGQGKTHLLCDIAERDMAEDRPRILLHGSHFTEGEPWGQVIQLLGLDCSTAEFLGALESAGEAYGCRVVILIDALNEGPGRGIWQKHLFGMLERIAHKPHIGLAVSVRSSYEDLVVPEGAVPERLTRVVHSGFAEHEHEAVHRYFVHYGIQPTTPLLVPEFSNPLFLKLFCRGVKGLGCTQVPLGIQGITAILDMLLDASNRKLSAPERMDYDRVSDPVRGAIDALVRLMAERDDYYLPRSVAVDAVNAVLPMSGHSNSLFRNLVAEGLLTENRWHTGAGYEEVVAFAYERFADHLLARHLLGADPTADKIKRGFGAKGKLRGRVGDEYQAERNAGLVEALSVQLPELVGRELFELAPHAADFGAVRRAFVRSLVWRAPAAFTTATRAKLNQLLEAGTATGGILDAMVTVGPVPAHPLNADTLHKLLSWPSMAARDSWWSIFLHEEWSGERSVRRLVEWTWGKSDLSALSDEVVLLTGTTLAWFLTTAHRFLRDRATKALVRLFENRLALLTRLLDRFWDVNDPYVIERLLASGYGSAMRSRDSTGLRELAEAVAEHVFRRDRLLPQLLTRDYARGIIEFARHRRAIGSGECAEAAPPSKSAWPGIEIPDAESLEKLGRWSNDLPREEWAFRHLYSSVMGNSLSDFSRYVIGDLDEWTSVPLGSSPSKSVRKQVEEFRAQVSPAQRKAIETLENVRSSAAWARILGPQERRKRFKRPVTDEDLSDAVAEAEREVERSLRRSSGRLEFFRNVFKPYLENPHAFRHSNPFDEKLARRWMIQRILDYGWTTERFGSFDREVTQRRADRSEHKPERIGKKYQWIAYRELLARLSDNFYIRADRFGNEDKLVVCGGPWEIGGGFKRDLDPSILLRSSPRDDGAAGRAWWAPEPYSQWQGGVGDGDWLKGKTDLPAAEALLGVTGPDGSEWLVLDTHLEWRMPARPGKKEYDQPQRMIWYLIRSHLVCKKVSARFFGWAKKQDFMGRWMPEPHDIYHPYLGESYWAPAFRAEAGTGAYGWADERPRKMPCRVLVTAIDHVTESSGLDCSLEDSIRVCMPAPQIVAGMGLTWSGREGEFVNSSGVVVAMDPSVTQPGPGALLVRRQPFLDYLRAEGLELVWTLLGEKQRVGGDYSGSPGWLQVSGAYRIGRSGIEGSRSAKFCARAN